MAWRTCIEGHIKKVEPDNDKIASILKMCRIRLRVINGIVLDEETASIIATDYYEVIKELLVALLLKKGLKSDNHECLISFFKENYRKQEYEAKIIYQLKDVRNRVSYDGVFVKKDYIEMNKLEFNHIIKLLHKLVGEP